MHKSQVTSAGSKEKKTGPGSHSINTGPLKCSPISQSRARISSQNSSLSPHPILQIFFKNLTMQEVFLCVVRTQDSLYYSKEIQTGLILKNKNCARINHPRGELENTKNWERITHAASSCQESRNAQGSETKVEKKKGSDTKNRPNGTRVQRPTERMQLPFVRRGSLLDPALSLHQTKRCARRYTFSDPPLPARVECCYQPSSQTE